MGRSRKSFDRLALAANKYKNLTMKATNIPGIGSLSRLILGDDSLGVSCIPIYHDIQVPSGTAMPSSVIEHFLQEAAHHVILEYCPCRVAFKCEDYDRDFGCTFIGEGAREIHPDVGKHVSAEEALEHLRKAEEAGLITAIGKVKLDAIGLGVKDHDRLMTICHCCPCCCLTNSLHYASRDVRDMLERLEGVTVEVTEECVGCGDCVEACIFKQIELTDGIAAVGEECKGCGRCAAVCEQGAITVTVDNPLYIEECISRIGALVDVK